MTKVISASSKGDKGYPNTTRSLQDVTLEGAKTLENKRWWMEGNGWDGF